MVTHRRFIFSGHRNTAACPYDPGHGHSLTSVNHTRSPEASLAVFLVGPLRARSLGYHAWERHVWVHHALSSRVDSCNWRWAGLQKMEAPYYSPEVASLRQCHSLEVDQHEGSHPHDRVPLFHCPVPLDLPHIGMVGRTQGHAFDDLGIRAFFPPDNLVLGNLGLLQEAVMAVEPTLDNLDCGRLVVQNVRRKGACRLGSPPVVLIGPGSHILPHDRKMVPCPGDYIFLWSSIDRRKSLAIEIRRRGMQQSRGACQYSRVCPFFESLFAPSRTLQKFL